MEQRHRWSHSFSYNRKNNTLEGLLAPPNSGVCDTTLNVRVQLDNLICNLIFFLSYRLLKGAHDLQLEKPIKQEFGGGYKMFLFDELEFYEGLNKL